MKVIASVTQKNPGAALGECVSREAVVNTDEHPSYKLPLKPWKAHQAVNHSRGEYQRQNPGGSKASTNTAESFFSLLKRAIIGSWHHVFREHLPKYAIDFAFRWNTRHDTDVQRLQRVIEWIAGKRLTYRQIIPTFPALVKYTSPLPSPFHACPHFIRQDATGQIGKLQPSPDINCIPISSGKPFLRPTTNYK